MDNRPNDLSILILALHRLNIILGSAETYYIGWDGGGGGVEEVWGGGGGGLHSEALRAKNGEPRIYLCWQTRGGSWILL